MSEHRGPKVTIWLGPKGSRMIGYDVQGQPVYATDDGAGDTPDNQKAADSPTVQGFR